jgi:hypothetical protein
VAALLQSYAKQEMVEVTTRYLMPHRMRQLLVGSGVAQYIPPEGDPYSVCSFPGGVHAEAGACSAGFTCMGYNSNVIALECETDNDCHRYGTFFTLSPQCVGGYCGMSWCAPACDAGGGCAAHAGWEPVATAGGCKCRPPFNRGPMGDCNIGNQPRVDVAFNMFDDFWDRVKLDYPEFENGVRLTEERYLSLRQTEGVGLICIDGDPIASDDICPEEIIFPRWSKQAKPLDFDGDGRADLVQWTNGQWKLDLSMQVAGRLAPGSGLDNFGSWDVILDHPPIDSRWVVPAVWDINLDGREDFVVYDKEHGRWYIAFTDSALTNGGVWPGWDLVLDYSSDWVDTRTLDPFGTNPAIPDSQYSRPAIGDYNADGIPDIAIACSDGYWRIDYGAEGGGGYNGFEDNLQYLLPEHLEAAPGWAYLIAPANFDDEYTKITFKVPDGLPDEGRMYMLHPATMNLPSDDPYYRYDWMEETPYVFGGNDKILIEGNYLYVNKYSITHGLKDTSRGNWVVSNMEAWCDFCSPFELLEIEPDAIYGGSECHPIAADFDGDGKADRAVMCPDEWRIAYSGANTFFDQRAPDGARYVDLGYDLSQFSLPGRSYAGGRSYAYVHQLIEFFMEMNPGVPPPIPVDMMTISVE